MKLALICGTVIAFSALLLGGDKKKEDVSQSAVSFTVLKDDTGKPVRNAAVVLHLVDKNGKQLRSGFELKTDADGQTRFDGIPYGELRVQVIAHGFQTFGDDFQIAQPSQAITVRLKQPQQQYSIYEKHGEPSSDGSPK